MSGLDQLLRLQKWSLDEKRRQASELSSLIERLHSDVAKLDEDVAREIEVARVNFDASLHLASYRDMMSKRRGRLEQSISNVTLELEYVREEITSMFGDIKKTEQTVQNRLERKRLAIGRREQSDSNDMGLEQHRRKINQKG